MKLEQTQCSETSTLFIHTPGNYPKEDNIRFSQHGESLKTRVIMLIVQGNIWVTQSSFLTWGEESSFRDIKFSVWDPTFQLFQDFIDFHKPFFKL
jgi:hypothetical protein